MTAKESLLQGGEINEIEDYKDSPSVDVLSVCR